MINVEKMFPKLAEIYTEEGVAKIYAVAAIIEKMCREVSADEIRTFLEFIDGGRYSEAYDMFYEIERETLD